MISPFEYITVLISIILGMGITQILTGVASLVNRWERVKLYWPHTALIILVFIIHIQEWWAFYEMRHYKVWHLATFLFVILYPVSLYLLARILFPLSLKDAIIDLKTFYYSNYKRMFLMIIILDVLAIIDNIFISGYSIADQVVQLCVMILLIVFVVRGSRNEWVHKGIAATLILITVIAIIATWKTFVIENV